MKQIENDPSISVVIPTLNRCAILPRAIDSVLKQTRPADEIIVIDNGSKDRTIDMLKANYPDIIRLVQSKPGVSPTRNMGISLSKSTWIALLDSDDAWHPEKLEKQLDAIKQNSGYRLIHTDEVWYRNGKFVNQKKKHEKRGGDIFEHCLKLCCISPSSALIHRELLEEVGVFDEDLPACEDYDLWLRISSRERVLFLNEPLTIKHGGHNSQLSKKYWGMDRFRIISLEKILLAGNLSQDQETATYKMLIHKLKILINGAVKRNNRVVAELYSKKLEDWELRISKSKQLQRQILS